MGRLILRGKKLGKRVISALRRAPAWTVVSAVIFVGVGIFGVLGASFSHGGLMSQESIFQTPSGILAYCVALACLIGALMAVAWKLVTMSATARWIVLTYCGSVLVASVYVRSSENMGRVINAAEAILTAIPIYGLLIDPVSRREFRAKRSQRAN